MRVYRLGEEPSDRIDREMTAEERMALVWQLTVEAWALAGREFPSYQRHEVPVRVVRGSEPRDPEK